MKKNYHHGNLKLAAVQIALEQIHQHGLSSLSLRGVAKQLGVSAPALYSHFSCKDELLDALATAGYQQLTELLLRSVDLQGYPRLEQLAIGYVSFACTAPNLFRLMFGAELALITASAARASAGADCFALIEQAVMRQTGQAAATTTTNPAVLTAWSLVHGVATLMLDGKVPCPAAADELQAFVAGLCRPLSLVLAGTSS